MESEVVGSDIVHFGCLFSHKHWAISGNLEHLSVRSIDEAILSHQKDQAGKVHDKSLVFGVIGRHFELLLVDLPIKGGPHEGVECCHHTEIIYRNWVASRVQ